jgi:PKD repeat protein
MCHFLSHIKTITLLSLLVFMSCSSDDGAGPTNEVVKPSNLSITANVVGKDNENPNGDGSGEVSFTISASNATSYKVLINNQTLTLTQNEFTYKFTDSGTKAYTVIVSAYNGLNFVSKTISVTVYVKTIDNNMQLVWQDEFDQDGDPNPSNWGYNIGNGDNGWGNGESQYYTNRPENAKVENGVLKITAQRENYEGYAFTSARMLTEGKFDFTYGRIDVRAKLPDGSGTWPAIWLLGANIGSVGWPACGEIDIMEHVGNNLGQVSSALHTTSSYGATINHKSVYVSNETTEFHLYSMIWTVNSITFLLDDEAYYTYSPSPKNNQNWPFTSDQFIILNVAMGGNLGGTIGDSFQSSIMEVDYVRVYQ